MTITITEFLQRLYNHRLLDHSLPFLNLEKAYWNQFSFDDRGAHYRNNIPLIAINDS
jgi:hypothetical protein